MAGIVLREVEKRFPDGTVAVAELDLEIAGGELMVLVGPSGCGKSTVLRMVAGLERPTAGTIAIGERIVNDVSPGERDVAMVFQDYALYPHMSAYQNIAFALKPQGLAKGEVDRRVREAARMLSIEPLLKRRPRALSGGERQRVAMGRALVREPQAFLMDEPLSNLDAKLRVQMRAEIRRLHDELETTFLYVTHDQVEAMTIGDRVAVLRRGELQQVGTPGTLYGAPANVFVAGFVGSPAINLFLADVASADAGRAAIVGPWTLALDDRAAGLEQVIVGIRPEHFFDPAVGGEPQPGQVADVIVRLVEPLGPTTLAHVVVSQPRIDVSDVVRSMPERDIEAEAGTSLVVASLDGRTSARPGEPLALGLDGTRALLFDAASGRLLRSGVR